MILKLENTTTHQIYEYEVKDMNNGEKLYFRFDIDTSNLVDGEYILSLYDGKKLITTDLLKIGDYNADTLQYKRGENTYINVTLDNSVQGSKTVVIETIDTTITPDDGFNSMGKVDVNAQPLYDNAYHIGHTDGYNSGLEASYSVGYEDGRQDQKNQLESITITENGTYSRENGYDEVIVDVPDLNGSYDEGYSDGYTNGDNDGYNRGYGDGIEEGTSNAGEIIAQTAQVLNITENGTYLTQYSDPILPEGDTTGYFDDGAEFNSYAYLYNTVYDTGIIPTQNSRLEFWYKDTNEASGDAWYVIIGAGKSDKETLCFQLRRSGDSYYCNWGRNSCSFERPTVNEWHHYIISYTDGIVVDGIKKTDLPTPLTNGDSSFYINSAFYCSGTNGFGGGRFNNGYFGMVKIDDQTFIPTSEGFKNYNTGELLEVVRKVIYTYTDNTPIYGEGNLIKTVNVNVQPKINPNYYNVTFGYSSFTSLPEWVEWENIGDYTNLFYNCQQLKDISLLKKINGTSLSSTFQSCKSIKGDDIKHLDISNVTSMRYTFYQAGLDYFPSLNTSNVTDFNYCFASCNQLKYVEPIDTSKATDFSQMFYDFSGVKALERLPEFDCTNVVSISQYFCYDGYQDRMDNLTDVGGWKNLKIDWTSYGLNVCRNLSYQSCINVLNGLYDFRGNGDASTTRTLKVHQNFLDTVGDEINIGTNKGWIITA